MSAKLLKIIKIKLNQDAEAAVALKRSARLGKLPAFYCLLAGVLSMSTRHWARSQFQFLFQANYGSHSPTALQPKPKPTAVRHLTNIPLICYTWQAATRPWAEPHGVWRMAHCMPCLRFAPLSLSLSFLSPCGVLASWRSSLAPVVSAYCCAFIVMAMFFVVSFGGIVNAAPSPALILFFLSLLWLSLMLSVLRLWARISQR